MNKAQKNILAEWINSEYFTKEKIAEKIGLSGQNLFDHILKYVKDHSDDSISHLESEQGESIEKYTIIFTKKTILNLIFTSGTFSFTLEWGGNTDGSRHTRKK